MEILNINNKFVPATPPLKDVYATQRDICAAANAHGTQHTSVVSKQDHTITQTTTQTLPDALAHIHAVIHTVADAYDTDVHTILTILMEAE